MSIYRRVLQYYRPFLPQTLLGLVLSLCGIALNLLKPWPFKIIVDDILPRNPNAQFGTSPDLIRPALPGVASAFRFSGD